MNIAGVVLHPAAEAQLDAFITSPSHAVLLAGPKGGGKTRIAAVVAGQLLAVTDPERHAYFRAVQAEKDSITIEQIRELINFFRLKVPGKASIRRVAVIRDADTMGTEAQNALLKVLEEPPADSVLILTSSHVQGLLPTIRSRTQLLQLPAADTEALTEHFVELGYETTAIKAALLRSTTNIAEAAALLAGNSGGAEDSLDLAKRALSGTSYDRLLLVDPLSKQKEAAASFVDTLATIAAASLETAARKGSANMDRWRTVLQATHTAQNALQHSGNAKLVLTELMLSM